MVDGIWQPLDGKRGTFIDVKDDSLVVLAVKPAEDGRGTIVRFQDLGGLVSPFGGNEM